MSVILITGCSSGFGFAAAEALARGGHTVVATMRDPEKAGALRRAAAGSELEVLRLDVTDAGSRETAVADVVARHGQIDVLLNNAGICSVDATETLGEADLRAQFETNVFGAFAMIAAVLPAMRARRTGRIVNVTSVAAFIVPPYMTGYAATKHALDALSAGLDLELRDFGIRVVTVAPTSYGTGLGANMTEPVATTPYGDKPVARFRALSETMAGRTDIAPVTEAIVEAATSPEPKLRYVVAPPPRPFDAIVAEKDRFDESLRQTQ